MAGCGGRDGVRPSNYRRTHRSSVVPASESALSYTAKISVYPPGYFLASFPQSQRNQLRINSYHGLHYSVDLRIHKRVQTGFRKTRHEIFVDIRIFFTVYSSKRRCQIRGFPAQLGYSSRPSARAGLLSADFCPTRAAFPREDVRWGCARVHVYVYGTMINYRVHVYKITR